MSKQQEDIISELLTVQEASKNSTLASINLQLNNLKLNDSNQSKSKNLSEFYEIELRRAEQSHSELMKQLNHYSQTFHRSRVENNLLLKRVNELEELNDNLSNKYAKANERLEERVKELEVEQKNLKEESIKLKETLDAKIQEMDMAEKENDEIVMKLKVDLENAMQAKKEFTSKAQELQNKLSAAEKAKSNLEGKLRDSEVVLNNKQAELDGKQEALAKSEARINELAQENNKVKAELEKYISIISFVKQNA